MYLFFHYGNPYYIHFVTLSASTGSVASARYMLKHQGDVNGSTLNGDYVIATIFNRLLIYSISSSSFTIKATSVIVHDCQVEPSSGRLIITGTTNNGYITKFYIQSINDHPDISSADESMITLPAGTEEIYSDSGVTIGSLYDQSISLGSYLAYSFSYSAVSSYNSDIRYEVNDKSISIMESTSSTFNVDLTCSYSGSTSISYSIKQKE